MRTVLGFCLVLATVTCDLQEAISQDTELEWWQRKPIYQIYPRSFKDSDGDGVGDLRGITEKVPYLVSLDVTGVWLSPIFQSPMVDFGYDISDYRAIDPLFGSMEDFEKMRDAFHDNGLKLILDFVPNHTSDQHEWFVKSVQREDPYSDYYVWVDPIMSDDNSTREPPSNWLSDFGGPAWEWNEDRQQYYLHQFERRQPDLNYRNPLVRQEMLDILSFWMDKGVDGFRMDAVNTMVENKDLLNEPPSNITTDPFNVDSLVHIYTRDQPETYEIIKEWRALLDNYTAETGEPRFMATEAYSNIKDTMEYYGTKSKPGAHFTFNFLLIISLSFQSNAYDFKEIIELWYNNLPEGKWANWVLGNHDRSRAATRYGPELLDGLLMLITLLPGTAVIYNGDEIGMTDTKVRWDQTLDPPALPLGKDRYQEKTRDPERTPFQWSSCTSAGFSTNTTTWLPVNPHYWIQNVETEKRKERSNLKNVQKLNALLEWPVIKYGNLNVYALSEWVLVFTRALEGQQTITVIINLGSEQVVTSNLTMVASLPDILQLKICSVNGEYKPGLLYQGTSLESNRGSYQICRKHDVKCALKEASQETALEWWQKSIYEINIRSFKDSDGDGIGDLKGISEKVPYLVSLGVTGIWLSPIFKSPMVDLGYDISDFKAIDTLYGSMEDFEELTDAFHEHGLHIILDFVPNHSSDQHEWFLKSVQGEEPYTDYYVWVDPIMDSNNITRQPPNNWLSDFGGSAWTWNEDRQQYYLHQFERRQPDLNYRNPLVRQEMLDVLSFWLDKGVDGFRMDAVMTLFEDEKLRDNPPSNAIDTDSDNSDSLIAVYSRQQPETYELIQDWRVLFDNYTAKTGRPRFMATEAYGNIEDTMKYYGTQSQPGAHFPFNFLVLTSLSFQSTATEFKEAIELWYKNLPEGKWSNWVLGNHDKSRVASRFGIDTLDGLVMMQTLLPGTPVFYNGDEIGMTDTKVRWDQTKDPPALLLGPERYQRMARDPQRTPFQWSSYTSAGFSTNETTWLPVNPHYWIQNVETEKEKKRSHLKVFRKLVALSEWPVIQFGNLNVYTLSDWVLVFTRALERHPTIVVILNLGSEAYVTSNLTAVADLPVMMQLKISSINSEYTSGSTTINKPWRVLLPENAGVTIRIWPQYQNFLNISKNYDSNTRILRSAAYE